MKNDVLDRMDQLGCAASLRALIETLPTDVGVVLNPGAANWLPLAGATGCIAGIYMNVDYLHLLLTPSEAKSLTLDTGCKLEKTNQTTGYVKVLAREAADGLVAPHVRQAVERALRRSATRPGPDSDEDRRLFGRGVRQRTCPTTHELVPASGLCEMHGATC